MSVPLNNYLTAFNRTAAAILTGALPEEEKREALALVTQAGAERLQNSALFLRRMRESCILTPAERIAEAAEGFAIHLHPKKPRKRKAYDF